ncbi:cysteine hydrolase family protein [Novosphingobium gossypii]|uniref:cysteine hydrolase family protein n=1 Tax=Novosphingobium gossypii TaxID=1604774 RepID=UPI003D22F127
MSDAGLPDRDGGRAALLIIDMMNRFDFEGAQDLLPDAIKAAHATRRLREQMEAEGLPVIYVNDNFDEWHSERSRLVERALESGHAVAAMLRPAADDYFIIKPQFSGFYATNLPVLLPRLGVTRLILSGIAADICVLFTAADAHMRDYALWVPEDAVAGATPERKRWALEIMAHSMKATIEPTDRLSPRQWLDDLNSAG